MANFKNLIIVDDKHHLEMFINKFMNISIFIRKKEKIDYLEGESITLTKNDAIELRKQLSKFIKLM
jgi:hypothetical protein